MDIKKLLAQIDSIAESMSSAEQHPTGPKFTSYWKGTNAGTPGNKMVGSAEESILKGLSRDSQDPKRKLKRDLAAEFARFKSEEDLQEYGGVGGYGAASQAPQGTGPTNNDPAAQQQKVDQLQIQKSTNTLAPALDAQGASQPVNKVKFQDVMNKLDQQPNTDLPAQDTKQLGQLGVAASKIIQNPQTASQFKQLVTKADQADVAKQAKVKQAQQQVGTNNQQQPQTPGQPPKPASAGQTPS